MVNSGGNKDYEINRINAVFIDFNCGRDENKQFYSLDIVEKYKEDKLKIINQYKHKPSFIIETRNGYHIYWLVNNATNEDYLDCQLRLIQYFNSDPSIKDLPRVMRLPNYDWVKDINNPYKTTVIEYNNITYDIHKIINNLPQYEEGDVRGYNTNTKEYHCNIPPSILPLNYNYIKFKNISKIKDLLDIDSDKIYLSSKRDVYNYLKQQDLRLFLGCCERISCIFHDDNSPSVSIFKDDKTGFWWYKCHSSGCGKVKDIISLVEHIQRCNIPDALKFLCEIYNIEISETDWQKRQREIIDENIQLLLDAERLEQLAPKLYKMIKNNLSDLVVLHSLAKDYVSEDKVINDDTPIFYCSLSELSRRMGKKSDDKTSKLINKNSYLGTIVKVPIEKLPDNILLEANKVRKMIENRIISNSKSNSNVNIPLTNFYLLPSYSSDVLDFAENKANEFKSLGFTVKGLSREMILRALGDEEANRVFPQMKNKKISEFNDDVSLEMEKVILGLIRERKYATEKDIIDYTYLYFKSKHKELNYKKTQIKVALPEIMLKYGLKKVKLSKEIKNNLSIEIEGYPYVIIKEN